MIIKIRKKIKISLLKLGNLLSYSFFCIIGWPISHLSYKNIHRLGSIVGFIGYHSLGNFRKRALGNLAIAQKIQLNEEERKKICKQSFQNLAITCLEFYRLKHKAGQLSGITIHHNPQKTEELLNQGKGVVFLIGHMANWEIPFIEITKNFSGIAIGKPLKNPYLNRWILSVREMFKGRIVYPRNAISTGVKELKQGNFVGIVGDQALPESSYSYPFLGKRAWTSPSPALLAYKTGCPIIVGTVYRKDYQYHVTHSDPIWPNLDNSLKEEVIRVMDQCMSILENAVIQHPGQWLWQHDRWKQSGIDHVKKRYRHGFILIILSEIHLSLIPFFKKIYSQSFLTFFLPGNLKNQESSGDLDILYYQSGKDLLIDDWRYQFVIDLSNTPSIEQHFKKLGAFEALNLSKMQKRAKKKGKEELLDSNQLESLIKFYLCK